MTGSSVIGGAPRELEQCRTEIEDIDDRLVAMLHERLAIARRVAAVKRRHGLPVLDPKREALVVRRAVEAARACWLDEEAVRGIFWMILGMSRKAQQERGA